MIVKKLVQKTIFREWDKKYKTFNHVTWDFYIGYYLFGFIPLYKILIDRNEELNYPEVREDKAIDKGFKFTPHVYKKYGELLKANKIWI